MFEWFKNLFTRMPVVSHYTIDGGNLAPHPGMTDEDLYNFEIDTLTGVDVSRRQWPTLESYLDYCDMKNDDLDGPEFVEGLARYVDDSEEQEWVAITKIVVPTARDKVQLLLALKYVHDLRCIDSEYLAVNTLMHHYQLPDRIEVEAPMCEVPPAGWLCTRTPGHEGPCAAWPL